MWAHELGDKSIVEMLAYSEKFGVVDSWAKDDNIFQFRNGI